jgi:hypothetical protein
VLLLKKERKKEQKKKVHVVQKNLAAEKESS